MNKKDREKLEEEFPANPVSKRVAPIRPETTETIEVNALYNEKPKKTIRGQALRKKRTLSQSIGETFFGDQAKGVLEYIWYDVLVPAAKSTLKDMVTDGLEMLLFGETGSRRSRDRDRNRSVVSYGSYYKGRDNERESRKPSRSPRDRFGLGEIYFRHGEEAEEVLEGLCDQLDQYQQVTVADYFELAGIEDRNWATAKWGWENLSKAYFTHTRNGYAIVLPEPIELD